MEEEKKLKFYTLPPVFNRDESPEAEELIIKMSKARGLLHFDLPFFGYLLTQLEIFPVINEPTIQSFAMDTRRIYVNTPFFGGMKAAEIRIHLLHAIVHIIMKHGERGKDKNNQIWGISCDINAIELVKSALREHDLLSSRMDMSYDFGEHSDLPHNLVNTDIDNIDEILYKYANSFLKNKERRISANRKEFSDEIISQVLDYTSSQLPCNYIQNYEMINKTIPAMYKNAEDSRWLGMLKYSYQQARNQGKLPLGLKEFLDELLSPQIPWYTYLEQYIQRAIISDYQWIPPNRRMINQKIYLPSTKKENLTGVIALDTSGSIQDDELAAFLSEAMSIFNSFSHFKLTIIQCDAEIQKIVNLDEGENIDGGALPWDTKEIYGRGGTSFVPVFNYVEEEELNPSILIYFTDGYGTFPAMEPEYYVYWVITTDIQVPFGETIRYQMDNSRR